MDTTHQSSCTGFRVLVNCVGNLRALVQKPLCTIMILIVRPIAYLFNGGKGPVEPLFGFSHPPGSVICLSGLGRKSCGRCLVRQRPLHLAHAPPARPRPCFTVPHLTFSLARTN